MKRTAITRKEIESMRFKTAPSTPEEMLRAGLESGIFDNAPIYKMDVKRLLKRLKLGV